MKEEAEVKTDTTLQVVHISCCKIKSYVYFFSNLHFSDVYFNLLVFSMKSFIVNIVQYVPTY